jgi:peroxiredoxin Q/BCP
MTLQENDKAYNFELAGDDGRSHALSDYKGRWVVLYFYPKDLTSGCTIEACEFNDALAGFTEADAVVFGVSKDSLASHVRFKSKHDLRFVLLSDDDLTAHKAYGAYGEKINYGKKYMGTIRSTFLIDPKGKVAKVWSKVRVKGHVKSVLDTLRKLNVGTEPELMSKSIKTRVK